MDAAWMTSAEEHVGIHKVCWGNKWMGSLDLDTSNKDEQVKQLDRASKTKQ